jgi:molecular chaperone DnaK
VVIPNQEGSLTTPSVVAFAADGSVLVGAAARRQAAADPANTFYSVKRFIGRDFKDAGEDVGRVAYKVGADEDGGVVLRCARAEGGSLYPEEVSAHVVAKLVAAAEAHTGRPVAKAVISVPAYFNDDQRAATETAGRLAGLGTVRIIREPVAAALAYGLSADQDQTVLVFDLGGGTFDVSLLEVGGGVVEVLSTGGDPHLGGDDWDAAIAEWLVASYLEPARVDCTDPKVVASLKSVAEAAKIGLSRRERVVVRMPAGGGVEAALTRQAFEGLTAGLFRRARLPLDQACWQAGVDLGTAVRDHDDAVRAARRGGKASRAAAEAATGGVQLRPRRRLPVSEVLLVGGATRMPAVRRFVKNMTGITPREASVDPDLAVALGAAVQAGVYQGSVGDLMVMDVWQASLMRAFAKQVQAERAAAAAAGGEEPGPGEEAEWEGEGEEEGEEEEEELLEDEGEEEREEWETMEISDDAGDDAGGLE